MKDYRKEEEYERKVLLKLMKHLSPQSYELSEIGSCEYWDFILRYKNNSYIGDIKCRTHQSTHFDKILLEDNKLKNLLHAMFLKDIDKPPLYIFHYTDGVAHILKLTPQIIKKYPPIWKTIGKVPKRIYLIPVSEAKEYKL